MPKCKDCIHSEICASHLKAVRGINGAVMSISGREVNHLESALSEIWITIGQICCDDCGHFQGRTREEAEQTLKGLKSNDNGRP